MAEARFPVLFPLLQHLHDKSENSGLSKINQ